MELKWLTTSEVAAIFNDDVYAQFDLEQGHFKYLHLPTVHQAKELLVAFVDHRGRQKPVGFLQLVAFVDHRGRQKPVGFLQLQQNPSNTKTMWMNFITIHPEYRQQGLAKAMLREMVSRLEKIEGLSLDLSTYEAEGEVLIDTVCELAQGTNLKIRHRAWGSGHGYQDAKNVFLREKEEVYVVDADSGYKGWGIVFLIKEGPESEELSFLLKVEEEVYDIKASSVIKKRGNT